MLAEGISLLRGIIMESFAVIVGATSIVIIVSLILKLCSLRYLNKEKKRRTEALSGFELLSEDVSYKKYKKIAKRSSVPNKPIRSSGDFLDFILESDDTLGNTSQLIENNLFSSNCGVSFDE